MKVTEILEVCEEEKEFIRRDDLISFILDEMDNFFLVDAGEFTDKGIVIGHYDKVEAEEYKYEVIRDKDDDLILIKRKVK